MLTPRKRKFAHEYLVDMNATQAAIRAGYSARSAESQGCRLVKDPQVAALLADKQGRVEERAEASAEETLRALAVVVRDPEHPQHVKAIELALKRHKLLTDRVEVSDLSTEDLVRAAAVTRVGKDGTA